MEIIDAPKFDRYIDENNVVFEYWPYKDGVKIIAVSVPENVSTLKIPEYIDNKPVLMLAKGFANSEKNIKKVIIPKLDGTVAAQTFEEMKQLESVVFSEGIEDVETMCFVDCEGLKNIQFPKTLKNIYEYAFDGCFSLETLNLPNCTFNIHAGAFIDCVNLKCVNVGGAESISEHAFRNCDDLEHFVCSEKLSSLGSGVFLGCDSLRSVDFSYCASLVPDYHAFSRSGIQKIILPDAVDFSKETTLKNGFLGCQSVEEFVIKNPKNNYFTDDGVLYERMDNEEIKLVKFPPQKKITSYTSPINVTAFGFGAFTHNNYLSNVSLTNVKHLDILTFYGCKKLSKLNVRSNGLEKIPEGFLMECCSIKKFRIPSGCTYIASDAFTRCEKLQTVIFPESIKHISDFAFMRSKNQVQTNAIVVAGSFAEEYTKKRKGFSVTYNNNPTTLEDFLSDVSADTALEK